MAEKPNDFARWDATIARDALKQQVDPDIVIKRQFFEGEHWQSGAGWAGPLPVEGDPGRDVALSQIERAFVSRNAVAEVIGRHSGGAIGKEPAWSFVPARAMAEGDTPTEAEQSRVASIHPDLVRWWNDRGVMSVLQRATEALLWAGRVPIRIYIPPGKLSVVGGKDATATGAPVTVARAATFGEALRLIYVETPDPEQAAVYENPATKESIGIADIALDEDRRRTMVELTFVDQVTGNTVLKHLGEQTAEVSLPLNGLLLINQMKRPNFISPQILQQQRALNLAWTLLPRAATTSGFLERVFLNAKSPGKWERGANGEPVFIPEPLRLGPTSVSFVQGVDYDDPNTGQKVLANPSVVMREPSSVQPPIEAAEAHYRAILEEADQVHALMAGDAVASAISRVQARADFVISMRDTVTEIERIGRWIIETVTAFAEVIVAGGGTGSASLAVLRGDFSCRVDAGPLTPEERATIMDQTKNGLMAVETAMALLGVDDPDAELLRMAAQRSAQLDLALKTAELFNAYVEVGIPMPIAGKWAGFTKEQITELEAAEGEILEEQERRREQVAPGAGGDDGEPAPEPREQGGIAA